MGGIEALEGLGADAFFGQEFGRGAEEVVEQAPFVAVEVVEEEEDDLGVIDAAITEPLADMGPVFLFDVGVIVFM